jgi:hypothetical protein
MRSEDTILGDCPTCGDPIYLFRTKAGSRVARCVNDDCEKKLFYPLPKAGQLEVLGEKCPLWELPIVLIVPNLKLMKDKYKQEKDRAYCWANKPCFACSKKSTCKPIKEILESY